MANSLPLVAFEQYMLAEDSEAYPRAFVIEVALSGVLRREALEAAWPAALARHALLSARLDQDGRNWLWPDDERQMPVIDWGQEGDPLTFADQERIDLTRQSGVRLWVRTGEDRARLVFQFHHACCDGVGSLEFIGDLLALYAGEAGPGEAPALASIRPELLGQRGTFGLTKPTLREWLRDVAVIALFSGQLLGRKPIAVAAPSAADSEPHPPLSYPGIESHTFSPSQLAGLRRLARQTGATLNDLMMAFLFTAIIDWNQSRGPVGARQWLRMNVPTSLRRQADEEMPAANVMSFAFIDRRAGQCANIAALVDSIRIEMEAIKRLRLSLYFIGQMTILAAIPGAMRMVMRANRCFASAVLTNVGDPTRRFRVRFPRRDGKAIVGNLVLENITGVPPIRALTRVGVALTTYAGGLTVSLLCDRRLFSRQQAQDFLATYLRRIESELSTGEQPAGAKPSGEGQSIAAKTHAAASDVDRGPAVDD